MEHHGRVAKIVLNRPKALNAMTAEMGDELTSIIEELSTKLDSVRTIVRVLFIYQH